MALYTRLTEMLSIEHPIISAPMAFAAGGKLASAVTAAGGLGLIGGGYGDAEWLKREFAEARNTWVGCGFITWSLAKRPELLELVLAHSPAAVMLSFGSPVPFAPRIKCAGAKLISYGQNIGLRLVPTQNSESQRNPGVSPAFRVLSRDRWCCAAACGFRGTPPAANCPRRSRVHLGNVG